MIAHNPFLLAWRFFRYSLGDLRSQMWKARKNELGCRNREGRRRRCARRRCVWDSDAPTRDDPLAL